MKKNKVCEVPEGKETRKYLQYTRILSTIQVIHLKIKLMFQKSQRICVIIDSSKNKIWVNYY